MVGNWSAAIELQERVEAAVAANVATPCVRNARSLLVCALAHAYRGEDGEACRLEREAAKYAMTGYGTVLDTPRLQLALHRGDLATVESLLGEPAVRSSNWFYLSSMAAHLQSSLASAERAFSLLDEAPDVAERQNASPISRAAGAVSFQNVSFTYDQHHPVLHDISFEIGPGTRVGIMGATVLRYGCRSNRTGKGKPF